MKCANCGADSRGGHICHYCDSEIRSSNSRQNTEDNSERPRCLKSMEAEQARKKTYDTISGALALAWLVFAIGTLSNVVRGNVGMIIIFGLSLIICTVAMSKAINRYESKKDEK